MTVGLYYPHIEIQNISIIKTGLLLWDRLEFIAPHSEYRLYGPDAVTTEALDLLTQPHLPTSEEKSLAHSQIMDLSRMDLPDWFYFDLSRPEVAYDIYPQKFLGDTWDELRGSRFGKFDAPTSKGSYLMSQAFGLTMMSILADCCAGSQKRTVTDEVDSCAGLARYLIALHEGSFGQATDEYDRLVALSIKTLNVDEIDLSRLVKLRNQELKGDDFLTELRENYLTVVDRYVKRLINEAKNKSDIVEIEREYEREISQDISHLAERLRLEAGKALLSKEIAVAVVATAGTTVEPISSSIIAIGSLVKTAMNYRAARREALRSHTMSWLYLARPGIKVF